ncbi:MAG: ABC transporter permease [Turicibacter sp.]|nr:ABC transporter permease [Turicibacter sp.]
MVKKWLPNAYLCLIFFFLYAPIVVLVLFSFNASSRATGTWTGFSLEWYVELFEDRQIRGALGYTLIIAILSTAISMVVGTLSAIGVYKLRKKARGYVLNVNYLPIISPEIVTAIGLMILFQSIRLNFGFTTMLLAHIMFSIPYVILQVLPRLYAMDPNMAEAAMDLGATPWQAIRMVVVPEIRPGIFSGALMAFTMSLDDFVISLFNTGNGVTNLSIEVYSMARRGIRPTVNALATLMVAIVFITVLIANQIQLRKKVRG